MTYQKKEKMVRIGKRRYYICKDEIRDLNGSRRNQTHKCKHVYNFAVYGFTSYRITKKVKKKNSLARLYAMSVCPRLITVSVNSQPPAIATTLLIGQSEGQMVPLDDPSSDTVVVLPFMNTSRNLFRQGAF